MNDFVIYTASDPVSVTLVGYLTEKGFMAYDEVLAEAATVFVFDSTKPKLVNALKGAEKEGVLKGPYRISLAKVGPGEVVSDNRSGFYTTKRPYGRRLEDVIAGQTKGKRGG